MKYRYRCRACGYEHELEQPMAAVEPPPALLIEDLEQVDDYQGGAVPHFRPHNDNGLDALLNTASGLRNLCFQPLHRLYESAHVNYNSSRDGSYKHAFAHLK